MNNFESNRYKRKKIAIKRAKKSNLLLSIFVVLTSLIVVVFFMQFFRQKEILKELKLNTSQLESQKHVLEEKIKELNDQIERVNSLEYIEQVAREKLGMIKSDETIYIDSNEETSQE